MMYVKRSAAQRTHQADGASNLQGAGSSAVMRPDSPTSNSPASTTGQDNARMPSIGSEIASLSIGTGSGAGAARQLASPGEQPAVRVGASGVSENGERLGGGQSGSSAAGSHQSGGGESPAAQHGLEAASVMQRQLAQLRLEGGGGAAPEHPVPEGKRLRRAACSAAEAPASPSRSAARKQVRAQPQAVPPAAASAAPADGSVQMPHDVRCGSQAAGGDGAAAEPLPQGTTWSVAPQGFASPQQPHFTLGVPGDATPTAKRRQLPPAAQVCLPAAEHLDCYCCCIMPSEPRSTASPPLPHC